jgi:hypothetical protein
VRESRERRREMEKLKSGTNLTFFFTFDWLADFVKISKRRKV